MLQIWTAPNSWRQSKSWSQLLLRKCKGKSAMNWYGKEEKAILFWKRKSTPQMKLISYNSQCWHLCLCCSWICHTSHLVKSREYRILLTFCDPSLLDFGTKSCNETYIKGTREDKTLKDKPQKNNFFTAVRSPLWQRKKKNLCEIFKKFLMLEEKCPAKGV